MQQSELTNLVEEELIYFPDEILDIRIFTSGKKGEVDKIHFKLKSTGKHYTFHFGLQSKHCDIHFKDEQTGKYKTILRLHHFTVARFITTFLKFHKVALYRYVYGTTINAGKLKKYHCVLFRYAVTNENENKNDFVDFTTKGKASVALKFKPHFNIKAIEDMFIEPEDIFKDDATCFEFYRTKNGIAKSQGYIFKNPTPGSRQLFMVTKKNWEYYKALNIWGLITALQTTKFDRNEGVLRLLRKPINDMYADSTEFRKLATELFSPAEK